MTATSAIAVHTGTGSLPYAINLLDMTEFMLNGSESKQKHTHVGLQVELAYFTLRKGSFVRKIGPAVE